MGDIPSSNQGNSGHQSHRTWAGVRGFGSPVPPKSPRFPPPLLSIPEGRVVGGFVAGSGLQLLPHNCFNWGYSPPSHSPREAHAGSAHLAPRQLPSPYDLTHCPQQRWKNAGQGLIQRPGGRVGAGAEKGPHSTSPPAGRAGSLARVGEWGLRGHSSAWLARLWSRPGSR